MKSFLHHIVDDLGPAGPEALKDQCFVFPSRRAGVYFNNHLQQKFADKTFWAPAVLSIEEFIRQNTPQLTVVDDIRLLIRLFEVYRQETPGIAFATFYTWGQTLLNDFDEIDRHLVDASLLYRNLQEVEDIEATFGPGEEMLAAIKGFKQVIDASQDSEVFRTFSKTWATVGKVYRQFKAGLLAEGWAYNGLCYRTLAEGLADGSLELPYRQVVFAGFNAVSAAEQKIIDHLLSAGKALVYLDADRYYLEDEHEEAGHFLRQQREHWRQHEAVKWIVTEGYQQPKTINIIGVAQKTAQAKAAVTCLGSNTTNTAIVLADESLLMPVLYALPAQAEDMNITMGYPVSGTATGNLVLAFLHYQASASVTKGGQTYFTVAAYAELLAQTAIAHLILPAMQSLGHSKSRYLNAQAIADSMRDAEARVKAVLHPLFSPAANGAAALQVLVQALLNLYLLHKEAEGSTAILAEGVTHVVVKHLQNLQATMRGTRLSLGLDTLAKVLRDSLKQLSAPFAGEPLAGLQVMGFLETRALDFENLVVLSVNEDLLPAAGSTKTYIPFAIRQAFKLPTFLDHNSIYAYHFFRLLQRAKKINLIYNTRLSVTGSGEKSRFILQLLHRFATEKATVKINHTVLQPPLAATQQGEKTLTITKTGEVLAALNRHLAGFSAEHPLTPTGLVDYVTCSLKYFLARVKGVRQPEEPTAVIDARVFGNLLHEVLERAYQPWVGREVTQTAIGKIIEQQLPTLVPEAFAGYDAGAGEVAFTRHVVGHLAKKILRHDRQVAPLKIIDLESKQNPLVYELRIDDQLTLPLGGKIDRLDEVVLGGRRVARVLDYKTGKFALKKARRHNKELPAAEYMATYFTDPRYKSGFQLYFYALVYQRLHPEKGVTGGIYGVKNLNNGVAYLRQQGRALPQEVLAAYETGLVAMLAELKDPQVPFQQTEDISRCRYCAFKTICAR